MIRFWFSIVLFLSSFSAVHGKDELVTASKTFTESVILGEMLAQVAATSGQETRHWAELGGTRVIWEALLAGEVDVYVDYTGTLTKEILALEESVSFSELQTILADKYEVGLSAPLGFSNSYGVGIRKAYALEHSLSKISDLKKVPDMKMGYSPPFMKRNDGWPELRRRYGLNQEPTGLDHDLALAALDSGQIDATDIYTTDAEIAFYGLTVLEDDLEFFPDYSAVVLYRKSLEQEAPNALRAMLTLEGKITAEQMQALNKAAKIDQISTAEVSASFLHETLNVSVQVRQKTIWSEIMRHTGDHLILVGLSLLSAIIVALPLGIWATKSPKLAYIIMPVVSIVQTIPSLALFVFLIPLLGIGFAPAFFALFIYSLLPIVRNTHAGLSAIPRDIIQSADALGLPAGARLRLVELPIALPSILAGIKTSAVINVGTATLGALIGAGGYGQPIISGIRLADTELILSGAVPAALMALIIQYGFDVLESRYASRGLKL
ncbi:glycine betaine ABC transporter substrate-binding protein [Kordiimonas laminariae]|uniref:glycine betaine ABC transporter substrate-binding protein n=1 Tax=Kordiimonas laminariae TaxID=2917717 RepID=UPI001FF32D3E|nr:glycine betaine ABC transporter substrate-binding protein [Kordiimonas laminariae]MCK0068978.1 ABC transporter permease subunit [Kordiimonas laminariae]